MDFIKSLNVSPFLSIYIWWKGSCFLSAESEALTRGTEKQINLFNFASEGFCYEVITTIQKIILSCFRDVKYQQKYQHQNE